MKSCMSASSLHGNTTALYKSSILSWTKLTQHILHAISLRKPRESHRFPVHSLFYRLRWLVVTSNHLQLQYDFQMSSGHRFPLLGLLLTECLGSLALDFLSLSSLSERCSMRVCGLDAYSLNRQVVIHITSTYKWTLKWKISTEMPTAIIGQLYVLFSLKCEKIAK